MTKNQYLIDKFEKLVAEQEAFLITQMNALPTGPASTFFDDNARYHATRGAVSRLAHTLRSLFPSWDSFDAWQAKVMSLPKLTAAFEVRYPRIPQ